MGKEDRGFASMPSAKVKAIASMGGKAAQTAGTAHQWTSDEAREAGRKGVRARRARKEARREALADAQDARERRRRGQ